MKKLNIIFISFLLLGSFFVSKRVLSANTDIVINEIGAYPTSTHQWIEIWNKGSESVNLISWKFWEKATNHSLSVSTTDSILAPNEYAVIVQDSNKFIADYPNFAGSIFDSSFILNKTIGEEIGLVDVPDSSAGHLNNHYVEKFTYIPSANFSLERRDPYLADYTSSNWQEHANGNTVGAVNSNFASGNITVSSTGNNNSSSSVAVSSSALSTIWSNLKINEFVSDPDSGNEWVELFNPATSSLDLVEGYICDSRNTTSTCKIINGNIAASSWLKTDLLTDSYLNNTGDAIFLKNPAGDIIDQVSYLIDNSPAKGQALARVDDGVDSDSDNDWAITIDPTPGAENNIVVPVVAQTQSGSGGGGNISSSNDSITSIITSSKKFASKVSVSKEKTVGLKWKIKYDLRLRQGEEDVFNVAKSLDPRGGRIEYNWNFGDKVIVGPIVNYAFTTSGVHEIIIHATSTAGTVDEKKINIMVYPSAETAGSGIIFSELLPRANSAEDEYIRLKNITDQTIDLSNWKIAYKNDVYEIPVSTTLAANDYLTFYQTITGFSFNNSGGQLLLLNQNNILLDEVEYEKSDEGMIYKFVDDKWNWVMPTTSAENLIAKISSSTVKKFTGRFFTDIAGARAGQKGDWARLKGVVSVLPGVFGSQYFYITDGASGIEVYQNKKDFPPLEPGDFVEVYGSISEANGIKRINLKSKDNVDILSMDNVVSSTELNLDEVDESLAGGMVQIKGEITDIKNSFMYVDSGVGEIIVYFKQGTNIDKTKFKKGENVQVVGILEQTKTGWQIWPRSSDDIESLGLSADLVNQEKLSNTNETRSKYVTATVGGVATLILGFLLRSKSLSLKRIIGLAVGFIKKDKNIG